MSKTAAPGTFASGVQIVREALPVVMSDLVKHAPENQKEKIVKLLDIWERGQTFPPDMLASMKQLLNGKSNGMVSAPLPGHACLMRQSQMRTPHPQAYLRATEHSKSTTRRLTNSQLPRQLQRHSNHSKILLLFSLHLQA